MPLRQLVLGFIVALAMQANATADTLAIQPNAPERYVVVKGDTLWDISSKFLRDPWLWPEIWQVNTVIANPHLIYPGDTLVLTYDKDGRPRITLERGPGVSGGGSKLSPQARIESDNNAIPTIPMDAVAQFLKKAGIIEKAEYEKLPYIVSLQDQRLIGATDEVAYVRGLPEKPQGQYAVIHLGKAYRNPNAKPGDILGYETLEVASIRIDAPGDPATVMIMSSEREVLRGDRVMALPNEPMQNFTPRPAPEGVEGFVVGVVDGISRIGQHQVVVVNVGKAQGIEPGHVFSVYQSGRTVQDAFVAKRGGEKVVLPDVHAGVIMVFRPFEKVSYALVMRSERDFGIYDKIKKPQ